MSESELLNALQHYFGYQQFRQGQQQVIQAILQQQDCLVLMPTGGGKSLCYQLPASILPGVTIVVSPLIALMKDQVDNLTRQGINAAFVNSSLSNEQIQHTFYQLSQGHIKLLYVAPERLLNHYFLEGLSQLNISFFAIDEAHCISQWGHDFRPAYTRLNQLKQFFPHIPIMALTATADVTTRKDIVQQLGLQQPYVHLDSFDRPNIRLTLASKYNGMQQVSRYIKKRKDDAGIIYCNSRWQVEQLAEKLSAQGIKCMAYHAGLENDIRAYVQDAFAKDNIQIVVATIAFGLGIDKPNIRFVIHYECPRSLESYYQEIGRAGRDGLTAEALLLYDENDAAKIKQRIQENDNEQRAQVELQRFAAMQGFTESLTCRRQVLLNYFAEYADKKCGNCDICLDPPSTFDGTIAAQKALSCVYRIEQQGNINYVIQVLRGELTSTIEKNKHNQVTTFGVGKDHPPSYWFSIIRQLIHLGFLQQDIERNSALCLTQAAKTWLNSKQILDLATPRLQKSSYWQQENSRSHYDKVLFAKLKYLRKTIAEQEDIAPFIIFNDATLVELAKYTPQTKQEMLRINGIGDVKLARYGDQFLSYIKQYKASN